MHYCYGFEAKSIQKYIFDSGRVADMVGASQLIDTLLNEPLDEMLTQLGLKENVTFSRRAGGSFLMFLPLREQVSAMRDMWSLILPQLAPGLNYVHAVAEGESKLVAAQNVMGAMRGSSATMPHLPAGTPLTRYNPRNGLPASLRERTADGYQWLDAATIQKRKFRKQGSDGFAMKAGDVSVKWPDNLEEDFLLSNDNRYIGVVHADGNGLGNILRAIQGRVTNDNYEPVYLGFSERLGGATRASVQRAVQETLQPNERGFMPARPLVLGGDDLTMIVRGDLAIPFTKAFLIAFEEESKSVCEWLRSQEVELDQGYLTACAGIAFAKINQPFYMVYRLTEELCKAAKEQGNREASAISFHRITTSFIPDLDWVVDHEMTNATENEAFVSTLGSYGVGSSDSALPSLENLESLLSLFDSSLKVSTHGRVRQLMGMLNESFFESKAFYGRWRKQMESQDDGSEFLQKFDAMMRKLVGELSDELPASKKRNNRYMSPLGDLLVLQAVGGVK